MSDRNTPIITFNVPSPRWWWTRERRRSYWTIESLLFKATWYDRGYIVERTPTGWIAFPPDRGEGVEDE